MKKETEKEFVILSEVVSLDEIADKMDEFANEIEEELRGHNIPAEKAEEKALSTDKKDIDRNHVTAESPKDLSSKKKKKNKSKVSKTKKGKNKPKASDQAADIQKSAVVKTPEKSADVVEKVDTKTVEENTVVTESTDKQPENTVVTENTDKQPENTVVTENTDKQAENAVVTESTDKQAENAVVTENIDKQSENVIKQEPVTVVGTETNIENSVVETKEEGKKKLNFKALMQDKIFLTKCALVVLVLIVYTCVAYNYRNIFFMGTTINGIECAGMTAEEAEQSLRHKVEDYELSIEFRDGTTEVISGESIGYKYVSDGSVQRLMDKQNSFLWLFRVFFPASYEVAESIEFDRGLLADEYYALGSTANEKMVPPVNSYVTYEGDQFVITPENEGNQIDHHAFLLKINEVVASGGTDIVAEECEVYARPTVFRDAEHLAKECEQLNELADVSITYTLPNREYVLDGNEVRNWLKVDDQGNYSITEEEMTAAIADFVERFAKEVDTVKTDRPFKATIQGDITIGGGSYGWKVNKKEEAAKIAEEIANKAVVTREPCYSSREVTTENNGFGDTYIEIDLSNQHLWYYIDGELYVQSDIVSGTYYTASRRTPAGIFLLTYKQRDKVLRGQQKEDGTYEYESPVSFWMPFNGGIGLHDATWRGSFGGSIYKYSGSHGCINLPYKKAQTIYAEIDKETPIICYY